MVRLLVFCVLVAVFVSWLVAFASDCYWASGESPAPRHRAPDAPPYPDDRLDNIFWFLQISDIHLSVFNDFAVADDFESFCSETLSVVSPSLVLATGDLTHAKFPNERYSQQFEQEWTVYRNVLQKTGASAKLPWLDIRGNHDNFDVIDHSHHTNRFMVHSVRGSQQHASSYRYLHRTSFGSYSFIALDACPNPGPRRPFNFFGILHPEDIAGLRSLAASSRRDNQTVWFSHYPSSIIAAERGAVRELMAGSVVHLCGHLHTLADAAPNMYGRHPDGHLELELADFKDHRRYRLMAFDHDLFSFADCQLHVWPVVLVTNPKDARFSLPTREPWQRARLSSHIRLLVFSPSPIVSVRLSVDGRRLADPSQVGTSPLYTAPWQPEVFAAGLHTISVSVKDSAGNEANVTQTFSLDGTVPPLLLFPQFLLLTNFRSLLQMEFLFVWLSLLSTLLLSWLSSGSHYFQPLVRSPRVFWPLVFYITYFGIGPMYVGELLTGVYGVVTVHGLYVGGVFLPGSMTYLHGILQVLTFQLPMVLYLNHVMSRDRRMCFSPLCHCVAVVTLLVQCLWVRGASPYGWMAVLFNPSLTWSIPLGVYLIVAAHRTSRRALIRVRSSSTSGTTCIS